ncbi:hypothetical protein KVT40_000676 [Elsinoe batatas]|uniref:DUF676 domain-containing protein n=1 Tax=Elsinoe batatas TaxID=2601811 RepID=A0A8K0LBR7_9PEZI|nr:hypothetical protein KVT40_000676 [Elsinoe batatas]
MRKTLLLVFIHGFKGGDNTFEKFPEHLRVLVSDLLPKLNVLSVVYPKFETRGELHDCVAKFKEWLQNKVIDLEVAAGTPSPTIDPSVRVALIGHSMGGIVAAETLLSIVRDEPVPSVPRPSTNRTNSSTATNSTTNNTSTTSASPNLAAPDPLERATSAPPPSHPTIPSPDNSPSPPSSPTTFLFPYIQAILSFDTPYLGIHPGVIAHGAEAHYNTASAAYTAYNQASKFFGGGAKSAPKYDPSKALPAAGNNASASGGGAGWGKYAMFAGGAAALAAGAAGAYYGREHITTGWKWAGEHLSFVGCLARGAEMTARIEEMVRLSERHEIGFVDFYTVLGKKAGKVGQVVGEERTFCVVPKEKGRQVGAKEGKGSGRESGGESPAKKRKVETRKEVDGGKAKGKGLWVEAVNTKSEDEITAHRAMFTPGDNPGYYKMSEQARNLLVGWVDKGWYEASGEGEEQEDGGVERETEV